MKIMITAKRYKHICKYVIFQFTHVISSFHGRGHLEWNFITDLIDLTTTTTTL